MYRGDQGGRLAARIRRDVHATSPIGWPQLAEDQSMITQPCAVISTFPGWKSPWQSVVPSGSAARRS